MSKFGVLASVAACCGTATLCMGTFLYRSRQRELTNAPWFKESCLKASQHDGVRFLIGPPPLEMGDVVRTSADSLEPSVPVEPKPLYVLKVPLKGSKGKGTMLLWMNFLVPIEEARKSANSWNVALIECQIGKKVENKFVIL